MISINFFFNMKKRQGNAPRKMEIFKYYRVKSAPNIKMALLYKIDFFQ